MRHVGAPGEATETAVIVPVKSFELAKGRLAPTLSPTERARLARAMAAGVLLAAAPLPVWVVCDDPLVAEWAAAHGARVVRQAEPGLNAAVSSGVEAVSAHATRAIVAHGDLPRASDLTWVGHHDVVTIVRDRHRQGTNVLSIPTRVGFEPSYGPGSAERHQAEATRLGLAVEVIDDDQLGWDVDLPEDLAVFDGDPLASIGASTERWPSSGASWRGWR